MATSPQQPVVVPDPSQEEQIRLLAEAIDDMRSVLGVLTKHAEHFIPGEAIREVGRAWEAASPKFDELLSGILDRKQVTTDTGVTVALTKELLEDNQLIGRVGAAKTSLLRRLKERFFNTWSTLPSPDLDKTPTVAAGIQYLEFGANVASSIPGAGPIKELLHLYKQHLTLRLQSGK